MAYTLLAAVGVVVAVALYRTIAGLQQNIAKARKTGLVYIVTRECRLPLDTR